MAGPTGRLCQCPSPDLRTRSRLPSSRPRGRVTARASDSFTSHDRGARGGVRPALRSSGVPIARQTAGQHRRRTGALALDVMQGRVLATHAARLGRFDTSRTVGRFEPESAIPTVTVTRSSSMASPSTCRRWRPFITSRRPARSSTLDGRGPRLERHPRGADTAGHARLSGSPGRWNAVDWRYQTRHVQVRRAGRRRRQVARLLRLVPAPANVRVFVLPYADVATAPDDAERLTEEGRFSGAVVFASPTLGA